MLSPKVCLPKYPSWYLATIAFAQGFVHKFRTAVLAYEYEYSDLSATKGTLESTFYGYDRKNSDLLSELGL